MTTANVKMTKREKFALLLNMDEVKSNAMLSEFITHEIELLDKKNSSKKLTPQQTANTGIKDEILDILKAEPNQVFTVTELLKLLSDGELTNQRVSAILRQMCAPKDSSTPTDPMYSVIRIEEKRKAYFQLNPYFED